MHYKHTLNYPEASRHARSAFMAVRILMEIMSTFNLQNKNGKEIHGHLRASGVLNGYHFNNCDCARNVSTSLFMVLFNLEVPFLHQTLTE